MKEITTTAKPTTPDLTKPLLRGWSHAFAAFASVILTVLLLLTNTQDWVSWFSLMIFGFSMIMLYTVSAVFHIGNWRGRWLGILRAFDHANIFIFIAASYTPIFLIVLPDWERVAMLTIVWLLAMVGVFLTIFAPHFPRTIKTGLYIGMGWVALLVLPVVFTVLHWAVISLFIFSGVLYTVGGVIFALRRPNPLPRFFGYHEIFHLLVVIAGAINFVVIWAWIAPLSKI
jgi:hemolysin III